MKTGFYLFFRGVDYFLVTDKKNRTDALTIEFLNKIQNHLNAFYNIDSKTVERYKKAIQPATCETKTLSNGRKYYEISGENFGGCGSFVDDGNTVIF